MRRTLLLADANSTIQRIVALTFAAEDVDVVSVSDGEAAIQRIAADAPDIVLADVSAPGRSGYEIAAYVKGRADRAHIPVLLVASAFEPVDPVKAMSAGCDGVLVKPFEPQQVIRRVRELMAGGSESRGSNVVQHPSAPVEEHATVDAKDDLGDYYDRLDAAFEKTQPTADMDLHHQEPDILGDLENAGLPTMSSVLGETSPPPVFKGEILFGASPVEPLGLRSVPPSERSRDAAKTPALDPFDALLAAESEERPGYGAASRAPSAPPAPEISDELVEAVATRVLERLAPHGVDELVRRIVADVAERLVREEIDRIRGRK